MFHPLAHKTTQKGKRQQNADRTIRRLDVLDCLKTTECIVIPGDLQRGPAVFTHSDLYNGLRHKCQV